MSTSRNINIVKLQVVKDGSVDYGIEKIQRPQDLADIGRKFIGDSDREMFVLVCLDTQNHINALNIVSIGSLNSSIVHPREVFKLAILNNSVAIAFIHNHPSGDPTPSAEDIGLTIRLAKCGEVFGIKVLDHIILGDGQSYASFNEQGLGQIGG